MENATSGLDAVCRERGWSRKMQRRGSAKKRRQLIFDRVIAGLIVMAIYTILQRFL